MLDPNLSYYGHPILPTGLNSAGFNGDELNGSGYNEPIWPTLFDTFIGLEILIITEEMLNFFVTGCPDYVMPCVQDTITFPAEPDTVVIRSAA